MLNWSNLPLWPDLNAQEASLLLGLNFLHYTGSGGGGSKAFKDFHSPNPTFKAMLSDFIKDTKALIKVAGSNATKQAFASYKGKDLLMASYGMYCHTPAIGATLCIEPSLNMVLHNMLNTIRKARGVNGVEMLKSTSLPLPKHETWVPFIGKATLSLPLLVQRKLTIDMTLSIKGAKKGMGRI